MSLVMLEKIYLTPAQSALIAERLADPVHQYDEGPCRVWNIYQTGMLAFFEESSGQLVSLVEASGHDEVRPGWWIDSAFRGRGYGHAVIDMLADYLKLRGVKRIGRMPIVTYCGRYDEQSSKLAQRLRKRFSD
jgi:RimJ/RimL family protein N-acetyltransferase